MKDANHRPDPRKLVEEFVASGRSERAFATVVDNLGRLVYSSALRRARNPQLAEEITQNVFAILARKADTLRRHPCLRAWVLETTRLQAASAMRGEKRRQRKADALASEAAAQHPIALQPMTDTETWKDAVPHLDEALDRLSAKERDIIVQRFYEAKKFREIAAENGQSEGACKKRVKRALDKLGRILSARGVAISAAGIASVLGSELALSAPAQASTVLAPQALAASFTLSTTTIIANTIQTMSKLKTVTMTAATVTIVAAVPFSQQRAEASRIESELRALRAEQPSPQTSNGRLTALGNREAAIAIIPANPKTAEDMLASLDKPVDHREFIRDLMEVSGIEVGFAHQLAWSRVRAMNSDERSELLRALREFPMERNTKSVLATSILESSPNISPRERLEELMAWGTATSAQHYMSDWAASDPEAAMEWFWEKRTSGELDRGVGRNSSFYSWTLSDLLNGLAEDHPAKGLDLYSSLPREEFEESDLHNMAGALARGEIERGGQTYLRIMLDTHQGDDQKAILRGVLVAHARAELFDEGMAVVDEYVQSAEEREGFLESIFKMNMTPGIAFDWLLASTPEEEAPAVIRKMMQKASETFYPVTLAWIDRQGPGVIRDHAYAGWVDEQLSSTFSDDFPRVIPVMEKIEDPALRAEIELLIMTKWHEQDKEKISEYLPADVLRKLNSL